MIVFGLQFHLRFSKTYMLQFGIEHQLADVCVPVRICLDVSSIIIAIKYIRIQFVYRIFKYNFLQSNIFVINPSDCIKIR